MHFDVWNTSDVAPEHSFDYYRSGLCATYANLTPEPAGGKERFSAVLKT